jgi:hypothetical protein
MMDRGRKSLMWRVARMLGYLPAPIVSPAWAGEASVFSPTGSDAAAYGMAEGYQVGGRVTPIPQANMVGSYSHHDVGADAALAQGPDPTIRRADTDHCRGRAKA